jgi:uncharacterized caspase-like protein
MGDVMPRIRRLLALAFALIPLMLVFAVSAARAEKRVALVVGNAGYQVGALATPANDAGLIAQTLQAAGFDVVGARDLDQDSLRRALRDFLEKATAAGPDTVAFIYVSGYGVQLEGENYFVPVDAKIARDTDVAAEAIRMSDYIRPLSALKLKASIVVLDAARANPFAKSGPPLAGGLALVDPEPGVLVAFNAAPGTVAPEGQGPYGPYAQALAEMMREGGLPLAGVFDRARLRVNDATKGAEVPWHASKVETSLVFFERAPDAPPPAVSNEQTAAIRARPIRDLAAQEAYAAALERDTVDGYSEFITAYPDDPMAARVRAIVAARREAITWRRSRIVDTPPAYWSYLRRYPQGPHAADAHRRLAFLAAAFEPPPSFAAIAYDLPPPPPEEIVYIRRPVLVFDDPVFAFAPPPPPVIFLAPPPPEFVVLAPPPPPVGIFVLPMPIYRPVPVWVRPPAYVAPPPNNVIYTNVHNTVVVNNVTNTVTITNPSGQTQTMAPAAAMAAAAQPAAASPQQAAPAAAPAAAPSLAPSLPPSVAQKAATLAPQAPQGGTQPSAPGSTATQPAPQPGRPLPGMKGQPLPSPTGTPATPTTPSAAITPGTSTPAPGSAKPATAPSQGPAAKPATPSSPSAAITPATPSPAPAGSAKPATSPAQTPAATPTTSTPAPDGRAKRKTSPPQTPAAKLSPTTPSATVTPAGPSPAPGAAVKPAAPPPQTPAAKPSAPTTPSAAITPGTQLPANKPATPSPQVPAAKPATPSALPAPAKPVIASPSPPPAGVAKPATPSPQIPAAHPAPPPAKPMTPAAAAAAPPTAAPKAVPPQPKGCPAGKTMAVVNGQPVCK